MALRYTRPRHLYALFRIPCNFSPIKIPIVRSFKFNKEKIDIEDISESFIYDKGKIYSKDSHPPIFLFYARNVDWSKRAVLGSSVISYTIPEMIDPNDATSEVCHVRVFTLKKKKRGKSNQTNARANVYSSFVPRMSPTRHPNFIGDAPKTCYRSFRKQYDSFNFY